MCPAGQLLVVFVALHLLDNKADGLSPEFGELSKEAPMGSRIDTILERCLKQQREHYIEPIKSLHTRQPISLNGLYDFCFDPDSGDLPNPLWAHQPLEASCKPGNFYRMPVPAAYNEILSNESAKNYMGWVWYQSTVTLPEDRGKPDTNWLVQFGSINYLALIWADLVDDNGEVAPGSEYLGPHVGGHLPIVKNVSRLVHEASAQVGMNLRLSIAVNNILTANSVPSGRLLDLSHVVGHKQFKFEPDFDFFHFAGLTGDVHLVRLPRHYIRRAYLASSQEPQVLEFRYCLANLGPGEHNKEVIAIKLEGLELDCDELTSDTEEQDGCRTTRLECSPYSSNLLYRAIREMKEWPADRGRSVRLRALHQELVEGTKTLIERDIFEMKLFKRPNLERQLERSAGQLQGFGMHHEQLFSGRSMSLPAIMKDLQLLKEVGANVLRTSHYPYSPAYLDGCDELGIMVIAECPAVGLRSFSGLQLELHKESLREMMLRDHEHPSIVMWSVANEPECQKPEARRYFEQVVAYARDHLAEYTTKAGIPLTGAIAQSHEADRIGDLLDIIMVNRYYGWYEYTGLLDAIQPALNESLLGWARRYGKPLVLSEFGAESVAGMHSGEPFSEQFQRDLIEEHERAFDQLAAVRNKSELNFLGAMIWNFADFSTHESLMRVGGNKKGVFTADRKPKMAAESVKRIFRRRAGLEEAGRSSRAEL